MSAHPSLLRQRGQHDSGRVGMIELFFDLVFVFAVTQLSHSLLANLTASGIAQTALLLLGVWWVWIYTSWVTNWLDPERLPVRLCLLALMLGGLLLSTSIPHAFGDRGELFAIAYVSMQLGRTSFFLWAVRSASRTLVGNFQRILIWMSVSGVCWIAGGFTEGAERFLWWLLALSIETVSPWAYFWVPGLGRSTTADWDIDGGHLAERCALFVIIALGESLLVTGATVSGLPWTQDTVLGFTAAVLGSILMWWIYFDTGAARAHHRIIHSADPGRQGRMAYTYVHVLIVAGIIVCAVADEVTLVHPHHATDAALATVLGGPACYLLGTAWFKWITNDRRGPPLSHLAGLVLLAVLVWPTMQHQFSPLGLSLLTTSVLAVVAVWESIALRRPALG